jgi:hypothetical protein
VISDLDIWRAANLCSKSTAPTPIQKRAAFTI